MKKINIYLISAFYIFAYSVSNTLLAETVVSINQSTEKKYNFDHLEKIPNAWYLVFMANGGSLTGHSYVTWGRENSEKQQSEQYCFGMYAKGNDIKEIVFGRVDGELRDGDCWSILNTSHRLIVKVDEKIFAETMKVYQRWLKLETRGQLKYELRFKDCITFLMEVAQKANLKIPDRMLTFPQDYVKKLMDANKI